MDGIKQYNAPHSIKSFLKYLLIFVILLIAGVIYYISELNKKVTVLKNKNYVLQAKTKENLTLRNGFKDKEIELKNSTDKTKVFILTLEKQITKLTLEKDAAIQSQVTSIKEKQKIQKLLDELTKEIKQIEKELAAETKNKQKFKKLLSLKTKKKKEKIKKESIRKERLTNSKLKRKHLLRKIAKAKLGRRYVWGATGPGTFDCSGFTSYVYKKTGINIPRTSREQSKYGRLVKRNHLEPGDLIFFDTSKQRKGIINHVGMYLGNNQFIHASSAKKRVVVSRLNRTFYGNRYKWARRIMH